MRGGLNRSLLCDQDLELIMTVWVAGIDAVGWAVHGGVTMLG